jgi:hypothetical protein
MNTLLIELITCINRLILIHIVYYIQILQWQAFFKEHPQFSKNDFYITGESYAGHYIPAFASRVHQGNKAKEGIHINLKVLLLCHIIYIILCKL